MQSLVHWSLNHVNQTKVIGSLYINSSGCRTRAISASYTLARRRLRLLPESNSHKTHEYHTDKNNTPNGTILFSFHRLRSYSSTSSSWKSTTNRFILPSTSCQRSSNTVRLWSSSTTSSGDSGNNSSSSDGTSTTTDAVVAGEATRKQREPTVEDDGDTDWVPPPRPLLGDQGVWKEQQLVKSISSSPSSSSSRRKSISSSSSRRKTSQQQETQEEEGEEEEETEESNRLQNEYEALKEADRQAMGVSTVRSTRGTMASTDSSLVPARTTTTSTTPAARPVVDWMKTRRSAGMELLPMSSSESPSGDDNDYDDNNNNNSNDDDPSNKTKPTITTSPPIPGMIPVIRHQLLNRNEIVTVLQAYGGQNIVTLMDDPTNRRMPSGVMGQVIVTAPSTRHLGQLSMQLVMELRKRQLDQVGVQSAIDGPQGNPRNPDEVWMVVDCSNYVVHIQTEQARVYYKLEYLWSFQDPIWTIAEDDEAAWDDYMTNVNPISEVYNRPLTDYDKTATNLQRNRYTAPHRQVVPKRNARRRHRR